MSGRRPSLPTQRLEFVAIVDPLIGSDRQSAWLSNHAAVPKFTTLDAAAKAGLDAIVVTAHSTVHADILRSAVDLGLSALVEKPFTISYADSEDIVSRAADKGVTVMVSQNYRFFPGALLIRDIVRDRRYGDVVSVVGEFWCDWAGKPYQHAMDHVMGLEMAVHHFDLCRAMFDADAVGGYVREWQPANSQYAGGGAIEALFDMKGAATDFPFTYTGSLVGRAPRTPWGGKWRIELDTETLVVDDDRWPLRCLPRPCGRPRVARLVRWRNHGLQPSVRAFRRVPRRPARSPGARAATTWAP